MTDPDAPDAHLLADLDAGLLDPTRAREVRRAALADPRSAAVLHALAATRADLAAVPAPVAPPDLVAGWMAALETAGAGPDRQEDPPGDRAPDDSAPGSTPDGSTPVGPPASTAPADAPDGSAPGIGHGTGSVPAGPTPEDPTAAATHAPDPPLTGTAAAPGRATTARTVRRTRSGPRAPRPTTPRRRGWVLLVAAAALVVAVLALRPAGPPDLTRVELAAAARSTVGTTDLGALADPARRDGCLAAAGHPGVAVLGGRQVRLHGTPGVLLVLSTGELGRFRVLVVTPDCAVLADDLVGG